MKTFDGATRTASPRWSAIGRRVLLLLVLTPWVVPASGHAQPAASAYNCTTSCYARVFLKGHSDVTGEGVTTNDQGGVTKDTTVDKADWALASDVAFVVTTPGGKPDFGAVISGSLTDSSNRTEESYIPANCSTHTKTAVMQGTMPLTGAVSAYGPAANDYKYPNGAVSFTLGADPRTPKPMFHLHDSGYSCKDGWPVEESDDDKPELPSFAYIAVQHKKQILFTLHPQTLHTIELTFRALINKSITRPGGPGQLAEHYTQVGSITTEITLEICPDQSAHTACKIAGRPNFKAK